MLWNLQVSRMPWLRERNVVEAEEHEFISVAALRQVNRKKHDNREPATILRDLCGNQSGPGLGKDSPH
jgi:hypothetical protein